MATCSRMLSTQRHSHKGDSSHVRSMHVVIRILASVVTMAMHRVLELMQGSIAQSQSRSSKGNSTAVCRGSPSDDEAIMR